MNRFTIKSRVYIGFMLLVILSVIIFGAVSWFTRGFVLEGARKIQYNSSLARITEKLRLESNSKLVLVYRSLSGNLDLSSDIKALDQSIEADGAQILSELKALSDKTSSKAAGDSQLIVQQVLDNEKAITQTYNEKIVPAILEDAQNKMGLAANEVFYSGQEIERILNQLSDEYGASLDDAIQALEKDLKSNTATSRNSVTQTEQINIQIETLSQSFSTLRNTYDSLQIQNDDAVKQLETLLMQAANATALPAITNESIPAYDFSAGIKAVADQFSILSKDIQSLNESHQALQKDVSQISSGLSVISMTEISNGFEKLDSILKANTILNNALVLTGKAFISQNPDVADDALAETDALNEAIASFGNGELSGNTSNMKANLADFKENMVKYLADTRKQGLSDIEKSNGEINTQFDKLSENVKAKFDEDVTSSQQVEGFMLTGVLVVAVVSILGGVLLAWFVFSSIVKPIRQMTGVLKQAEKGHIRSRINTKVAGEFTEMAESMNKVLDTREQILNETVAVNESIAILRGEFKSSYFKNRELLKNMVQGMQGLLKSFPQREMNLPVQELVAATLEPVQTMEVDTIAQKSMQTAQEAKAVILKASETVKDIARQIEKLEDSSGKIETITNTITQIAKRTNLLALNAAIEAAKAGEQGRGFAVLADEIRKLADASGSAASDIKKQLNEIQERIHWTVQNMDQGVEGVEEGVSRVGEVHQSIEDITGRVRQVMSTLEEYANVSGQQLMANQRLVETITDMSSNTDKLYQSGKTIDKSLKDTTESISGMDKLENMLNQAHSRLNTILAKYKEQ